MSPLLLEAVVAINDENPRLPPPFIPLESVKEVLPIGLEMGGCLQPLPTAMIELLSSDLGLKSQKVST